MMNHGARDLTVYAYGTPPERDHRRFVQEIETLTKLGDFPESCL